MQLKQVPMQFGRTHLRSVKPSYTIFSQAKFGMETGEAYLLNQRLVGLKPKEALILEVKGLGFKSKRMAV